ncbi:MAG: glycosyltransferase [Candidatus Microgenomates bacterium]|jgi:glycosyltransferase involved in cell wall biosynthesis
MNIWAQTLVKNEERWLWYSVASVVDHVDKVLLWDTGSTDESLEIEKELIRKFPEKIELKERKISGGDEFTEVRQEMLDVTKSDWFIVVDGDEIWYEDSVKKVIETINREGQNIESIVVPTLNLVGDIFHYQEKSAGRYKFGNNVGHYNLRAVRRNIPGLHSEGVHGVWGWADSKNRMIQDRNLEKVKFVDAPYLHTTFLPRGGEKINDREVIKRSKKLKYEFGISFPLDFYYPEAFFREKPEALISPWSTISIGFKFGAFFETPLRKLKRKVWWGKEGY